MGTAREVEYTLSLKEQAVPDAESGAQAGPRDGQRAVAPWD